MTSHAEPTSRRTPSAIDAITDAYFDELCVLSPSISLFLGTESPHGFDDYSPEGLKAANDLRARTLAKIDAAETDGLTTNSLDETDLVTIDAMRERVGAATDPAEADRQHTSLNANDAPIQLMRNIVDPLPTDTAAA